MKTRRVKRNAQSLWMLWATDRAGAILMQKRPTPGVWAGLYCFALFDSAQALQDAIAPAYRKSLSFQAAFKHVLTHKDLHLHPVGLQAPVAAFRKIPGHWFSPTQWPSLGMPAPVRKLLLVA